MTNQEFHERNVQVRSNFTTHQIRVLLEGNGWLLSAIQNNKQEVTNSITKELDVIELNELLKRLLPKEPEDNEKFLEDIADQQVRHMYD